MAADEQNALVAQMAEIEPPGFGEIKVLAPGLLWTRLPVPMSVKHVNIYLIEDGGGWAILDAGFGDTATFDTWERLIAGPLNGERLTRLIVTHTHVDHVGAAGWLCDRLKIPLYMSEVEYLTCRMELAQPDRFRTPFYTEFFRRMGVDDAMITDIADFASMHGKGVGALPDNFHPLADHQFVRLGRRDFQVLLAPGHSPAQVMLYSESDNWLFSVDQLLTPGPPLLIVPPTSVENDTYGHYLRSLDDIERRMRPNVLIFPGHNRPHSDMPSVIAMLRDYHSKRTKQMVDACAKEPRTALTLAHLLFGETINARQTYFAIFEVLAYLNYQIKSGKILRSAMGIAPDLFTLGEYS